jgi:SAM-dependent methyltransferase
MSSKPPGEQEDKAVQSYFRKIYSDYQEKVEREDVADVYGRIKETIEPHLTGIVVDIGSGGVSRYQNPAIRRLISVDNVLEFLRNSKDKTVLNVAGDIRALPLKDGSVDRIVVQFVIHHLTENRLAKNLSNVRKAVAESSRILRPGGKVYFVDSMVPFPLEMIERPGYLPAYHLLRILNKPMVFFFSVQSFCRLLRRYRLAPAQIQKIAWGKMAEASAALFPRLKFPLRYAPVHCLLISAVKR